MSVNVPSRIQRTPHRLLARSRDSTPILSSARAPDYSFYAATFIVFVFLVLRRSAAYAGVPPLYGGEIALVLFAVLFLRRRTVAQFLRNPFGIVVALYALLPVPYLLVEYDDAGVECIMYASIAYYAAFAYFGYAVVHTRAQQDRFLGLLYYAIVLSDVHSILARLLPLREISPLVNEIPLLGNSDSCYIYYALGLAYVALYAPRLGPMRSLTLLGLSLGGHAVYSQRGSLLGICGVGLVLLWCRRFWWRRSALYLVPMIVSAALNFSCNILLYLFKLLIWVTTYYYTY